MRTIKLKRLEIENFKCFKHKVVDFADKTTIKGQNGCGKSSLYDALLWVLFDKTATGQSATDIRPHDAEGQDIHFVDISVSATFDVDGREITLKKVQSEKWTKKRGIDNKVFEGNVNTFFVNDIPKGQKEYKAYIADNFCDEEAFLSCTNAQSFFKLDTKKRRAKLLALTGALSDQDVIGTDKAFLPLADALRDGTVDELITRSKSQIKRLNDALSTLPARIDEQEHSKIDIDTAELELEKKSLLDQIKETEDKRNDLSKQYEEYQAASDRILEIQFEMNEISRRENEGLVKQKTSLNDEIFKEDATAAGLHAKIKRSQGAIEAAQAEISNLEKDIQKAADEWKAAKERKFDTSSLVCPYCGQEYPESKKDALLAEFQQHKADELETATKKGMEFKKRIEQTKTTIAKLEKSIADMGVERETHKQNLEKLKAELLKLPESVDVSKFKDYQKLQKELNKNQKLLENSASAEDTRRELSGQISELQSQVDEINAQLVKAQRNIDIDERIEDLREQQVITAQHIANQEKILDLLERFNRAKMNMLTEEVNRHFGIVKWKLFEPLINGGYSDVCFATVGGTNRERGLNDSDCLLADLDILETFQKMNGLQLPLWLDRAESINQHRIPQTDGQLICLVVSEDKEMIVDGK